jgi:hypothetical protein
MARRHGHGYYGFWSKYRRAIREVTIPPESENPYVRAARVFTGSAPILRFHARAVDNLVSFYQLLRTVQELVTAAAEAVRVYITGVLGYRELGGDLAGISRSVATRFNEVVSKGNILGVIVGAHGGKPPIQNWRETRRLKPLASLEPSDYEELRTLELGVDIILEPTRTVRRLVAPLNHTKIYKTKRIY